MEEFQLLNKVKWLCSYTEKYIFSSFPKVHLALKIKIDENLYSLLENTIRANLNKGNIRNKYQKDMLANIVLLDYYIGQLYSKKIIIKKRFISFINCLIEIKKMTNGWMNYKEN